MQNNWKLIVIRGNALDCFAIEPGFQGLWQNAGAAVLRGSQQYSSCHVNVDQSTCHEQAVGVLIQAAVTHFVEAKDPFQNQNWILDLRSHPPTAPQCRQPEHALRDRRGGRRADGLHGRLWPEPAGINLYRVL